MYISLVDNKMFSLKFEEGVILTKQKWVKTADDYKITASACN